MLDGRHEAKPTAPRTTPGSCAPISARGGIPKEVESIASSNGSVLDGTGRVPNRATLRRILETRYPTSAQLDAFILDSFFGVFRKFSAGMETTERINLLLSQVSPAAVCAKLQHIHKEDAGDGCAEDDDDPQMNSDAVHAPDTIAPPPDRSLSAALPAAAVPSRKIATQHVIRVVFRSDADCVDLLDLLAEQGLSAALADLCPVPILGGFRRLRLHKSGAEYRVSAFPFLLTRDGELALADGLRVPAGAAHSRSALYLPSGRSAPGYILTLDVDGPPSVTLRRRDISLTFHTQPEREEVSHA